MNKHYRPTLSKLLQEFPPDQNSWAFETQELDILSVTTAEIEPTDNEDINFEVKREVDPKSWSHIDQDLLFLTNYELSKCCN